MSNYTKGQHIMAEKKLQKELEKPERIKKEAEFSERFKTKSDEELIAHIAALKIKRGKRFDRYTFIGYQHAIERFGSWSKMIYLVNQQIETMKQEKTEP
ncbi:MAG: hypothetical protein IJF43_04375 [Firmicutes bacterium]|nr:hypothetical protein [Bacillota bacterium]MBQ4092703.1 hypothetical protein [Bacillota bacterium]